MKNNTFPLLLTFWAFFLLAPKCIQSQHTIEQFGHYSQIGLPLSAIAITIAKKDKQGLTQLAKSIITETVLVYGLKNLIDRKRPNDKGLSFPSGHTALAFSSSTYLWKRYGWKYGVPATILASFVGYTRFALDEPVHHFTDVLAGAALGIILGYVFTSKFLDLPFQLDATFSNNGLLFQFCIHIH